MATDQTNLEPIDPRTAQQLYLDHKRTECTESTVRNHKYHTNYLVDWCEENDVENLNELTGRNLQEIRLWRKEVGDINLLTLNNHISTLRVFLKWAASIEAVPENLYDKVMVPRVAPRGRTSRRDPRRGPRPGDSGVSLDVRIYLLGARPLRNPLGGRPPHRCSPVP